MSDIRFLDRISRWMGWCPNSGNMPEKISQRGDAVRNGVTGASGPALARSLLFSRLSWMVAALSYLAAFVALPMLPEIIPVHWNLYGDPDGFSSRLVGAFGPPVIITLTLLFLQIIPRFDRRAEGFEQGRDLYQLVVFATISMLFGLEVVVLLIASGIDIAMEVIFPMMLGLLFIVIGGVLPHLQQNTTIGIRLPWTLRDERNWKKTHQQGGILFVAGGILMVLASPFAGRWSLLLLLTVIVVITLYLTISSFLQSKRSGDISR